MKNKQQNYDLLKGHFNKKTFPFCVHHSAVTKEPPRDSQAGPQEKLFKLYFVSEKGIKDDGDKRGSSNDQCIQGKEMKIIVPGIRFLTIALSLSLPDPHFVSFAPTIY